MIEYVSGNLASKKPTEAVIDVHGLGYRLLIPTSTFERLPAIGKPVHLVCYQHVREDALLLFGFQSARERTVFNLLLSVSGIGPKLALAALSALRPSEIRDRIVTGDAAMLTRIPGAGRKTAERMIVELRDRFESLGPGDGAIKSTSDSPDTDALAALEALGLSRSAADKVLISVRRKHPDATTAEELIRLALRD